MISLLLFPGVQGALRLPDPWEAPLDTPPHCLPPAPSGFTKVLNVTAMLGAKGHWDMPAAASGIEETKWEARGGTCCKPSKDTSGSPLGCKEGCLFP